MGFGRKFKVEGEGGFMVGRGRLGLGLGLAGG